MKMLYLLVMMFIPGLVHAAEALVVAVSSSLLAPARQLAEQFEKNHHIRVKLVSGSTGLLYSQISHGAPYGVFMAADELLAEKLRTDQRRPPSDLHIFATGRLYFCEQQRTAGGGAPDRTVAMADPRLAPYGRAAKQVLQAGGLPSFKSDRVIYTPNVMMAASHFERGVVDAAFIASPAVSEKLRPRCRAVNPSWHEPVRHSAVLLIPGLAAEAWFSFIHSTEADKVWVRAGLITEAG